MKYLIYGLIVLSSTILIYNLAILDYKNPFAEESIYILIGIFASLCAIVLMLILMVSKKIKEKMEA